MQEQLTRTEWLAYAGKLMMAQNDFETGDGGLALHYLDECQWNLRGWEHRYLWTRINARQTLVGHAALVWSVGVQRDGNRILTGSWDKTAKVWDAATGQELLTLKGHNSWVLSVAFSPDGKRIVTGAGDFGSPGIQPTTEASVWDAATGRQLFAISGHRSPVWSVAFSPDGKQILSGSRDGTDERVGRRDGPGTPSSSTVRTNWRAWRSVPTANASSPAAGGTARVWDAATGQELLTFERQARRSARRGVQPRRQTDRTAGENGTVKVWDAATGQEFLALKGHTALVFGVAFSPDGRRIVSGS